MIAAGTRRCCGFAGLLRLAALAVPLLCSAAASAQGQGPSPARPANAPGTPAAPGASTAPTAADRAAAAKKPGAAWYRGNYITLDASEPTAGFRSRWMFERTPGNDIRLVLDEQRKAGPQSGTVLIIGQKALLTRDMVLARKGALMPAVDGPTLLLNLTLRLLERGVPDGPQSVRRERSISVKDDVQALSIETPSAAGTFLPPWQLTGKVVRKGDAIEFDLLLVSRSRADAKASNNTALRGSWRSDERKPPELRDDMPLEGWALHAIAGVAKEVNRRQAIVYDALPRQGFATLGELRKAIELGWPAQPDTAYHGKKQ
ncbi:MAG: hypothetical protein ACK515_06210 [bacterium]|jgi:hypothetical protein|nr:hypothetical protein [Betaproteobacteria bacterium]